MVKLPTPYNLPANFGIKAYTPLLLFHIVFDTVEFVNHYTIGEYS